MSITFGCVQEQITDSRTRYVLVLWRNVSEDHTRGHLRSNPRHCRLPQIRLSKIGESEQPQHGLRGSREYPQPCPKRGWFNLRPCQLDGEPTQKGNPWMDYLV